MNIKSWVAILAVTTVSLVSSNTFTKSSNAQTSVKQVEAENTEPAYSTDKINFYCGQISEDSGETIPATIAYVPQRKANVAIIAWKSNYVPEWDAQKRCETVSPKFQTFLEDGRLSYLTTGENSGYPIICATMEKQPCKAEDQLFQVKASSDPQAVLEGLTGIISGDSSKPVYQSSGDKVYVSMEELLNNAPAIEEGDLTAN